MALRQANVVVRGRVHGVAFRASTEIEAKRLGLVGWVKYREDGSVEICASGDAGPVKELVEWSRRGPEGAVVEHVDVRWEGVSGALVAFRIVD